MNRDLTTKEMDIYPIDVDGSLILRPGDGQIFLPMPNRVFHEVFTISQHANIEKDLYMLLERYDGAKFPCRMEGIAPDAGIISGLWVFENVDNKNYIRRLDL